MTVIPDPSGAPDLVLRANSLAAFLWLSAVSALKRRVAMRRCRTCGDWFELPRRDALYCSNACRVAHHREEMAALERSRSVSPTRPAPAANRQRWMRR